MTNASPQQAARIMGLRANALAAVVMLLIQYCLGISVNLDSTLPASDHGKSLFGGFPAAVGNGPELQPSTRSWEPSWRSPPWQPSYAPGA